jgi:hypothetical protein
MANAKGGKGSGFKTTSGGGNKKPKVIHAHMGKHAQKPKKEK